MSTPTTIPMDKMVMPTCPPGIESIIRGLFTAPAAIRRAMESVQYIVVFLHSFRSLYL